jgi:hypothetical protein
MRTGYSLLTDAGVQPTKPRWMSLVDRSGLIACQYRAAEWRHKEIELAAHDLLQHLDATSA